LSAVFIFKRKSINAILINIYVRSRKRNYNFFIQKIESEDISKNLQVLICPFGLVGAGKSTVVKPLANLLKIPRVSGDEIRKVLKEKGLSFENLDQLFFGKATHFLEQGYGLVVDSDVTFKLSLIDKVKEKYRLRPILIHINPPEEFILNKLRNYKGEQWLTTDQEEMVQNYFERKFLHTGIIENIKFDFEVDTSSKDLDKIINDLASSIKDSSFHFINSIYTYTYKTITGKISSIKIEFFIFDMWLTIKNTNLVLVRRTDFSYFVRTFEQSISYIFGK
jgi:predicted kinase